MLNLYIDSRTEIGGIAFMFCNENYEVYKLLSVIKYMEILLKMN